MTPSAKDYRNQLRREINEKAMAAFKRAKTDKARQKAETERLRLIAMMDEADRADRR
jgi:hypothetical protein